MGTRCTGLTGLTRRVTALLTGIAVSVLAVSVLAACSGPPAAPGPAGQPQPRPAFAAPSFRCPFTARQVSRIAGRPMEHSPLGAGAVASCVFSNATGRPMVSVLISAAAHRGDTLRRARALSVHLSVITGCRASGYPQLGPGAFLTRCDQPGHPASRTAGFYAAARRLTWTVHVIVQPGAIRHSGPAGLDAIVRDLIFGS